MFIWTLLWDTVSAPSLRAVRCSLSQVTLGPPTFCCINGDRNSRFWPQPLRPEFGSQVDEATWEFLKGWVSPHKSNVAMMCLHRPAPGAVCTAHLGSLLSVRLLTMRLQWSHDTSIRAFWGLCHYSGHLSSQQERCILVTELGIHK